MVGTTGSGRLQEIPITGGTIYGETIAGKMVLWGSGLEFDPPGWYCHVFAKYLLETDGGKFIAINNERLIDPESETVTQTKPIFAQTTLGNIVILTTVSMWASSLEPQRQRIALIFSFTNYGTTSNFS